MSNWNILLKSLLFVDDASGEQISKLADESLVPTDQCLEDEVLQFAERFLEWALINKALYDSDDPDSVDLNAVVLQAREFGISEVEKKTILEFQFDQMDHNKDDLLQKSEVDGILTHVPHEECLFGFIISSDTNKDHVLDRTEWEEGFAHVESVAEDVLIP